MQEEEAKREMFIDRLFLAFIGLSCGLAVASGTFALLVSLKIIPRMIGKSHTAIHILCYENMIIAGGIAGTVLTAFPGLKIPLGWPLLVLYGFCSGMQVGCLVMALAEIMNVFPILFRRLRLKSGMAWVIAFLAVGKMIGGLFYFYCRMY